MDDFTELTFTFNSPEDYHRDLVIDALASVGYNTFENTEAGFKTYIASADFDPDLLNATLGAFGGDLNFSYETAVIPGKNWNEVWESNFSPILINDQCYVRATFHEPHPEYPYEIVIDPRMSFGTGHHQTTSLMMEAMLEEDFTGKSVLDMGCGTGILSILADKLGSEDILAVDIDPVCTASTVDNSRTNHAGHVRVLTGSKEVIPQRPFDIILANINRNILLEQFDNYAKALTAGGILLTSGFYLAPDLEMLTARAKQFGLSYIYHKSKDEWTLAKFIRTPGVSFQ